MPAPKDKRDLQRFLGMIQYLAKIIPVLSDLASAMRSFLMKESDWCRLEEHHESYDKLKQACGKQSVLHYYDVSNDVALSVDARMLGLGAVCLQEGQYVAYTEPRAGV